MPTATVEDYKQIIQTFVHIPKRERSKMKRQIKRWTLKAIDPTGQNRAEAMLKYRRHWEILALKERMEGKKNAKA